MIGVEFGGNMLQDYGVKNNMRLKVSSISDKKGLQQKVVEGVLLSGEVKLNSLYELKEIDEQTDLQRKLFNPLVRVYYDSAMYPYKADCWLSLREEIKKYLGQGIESVTFSGFNHEIVNVKYKDIKTMPRYIYEEYIKGNSKRFEEHLKSMRDYSKKQMCDVTNSLIIEMIQNEVLHSRQGKKFNEILEEIGFIE